MTSEAFENTTWIVGPVAWDSVVYTQDFPRPGAFTQGIRFEERAGGTGANVARALASAGVKTGFVGYLGSDSHGQALERELAESKIHNLSITKIEGPTSHVLILVDSTGDRTILGMAPDHLDRVSLSDVPLQPGDTVVFVVWREHFRADLELARAAGCRLVVGLDAVLDPAVTDCFLAIGSHHDLRSDSSIAKLSSNFERIVVTMGEQGATEYSGAVKISQPALPTTVVDATGAGDSFLAGYLAALAHGVTDSQTALRLGATWAAATVASEASIPPNFDTLGVTL